MCFCGFVSCVCECIFALCLFWRDFISRERARVEAYTFFFFFHIYLVCVCGGGCACMCVVLWVWMKTDAAKISHYPELQTESENRRSVRE